MAVLCDNNAEQSKFWFSRSPCGDARYLVILCSMMFDSRFSTLHREVKVEPRNQLVAEPAWTRPV
jgi:hypothetical protein